MKRIRVFTMLWTVAMMVFGTYSAAFAAGPPETTSLVVKLVSGLAVVDQAAVIARDGGVETSSIPALRLHVIAVPTASFPLTLQNYQTDPQVESVELNKTRKAEGVPGDLNYGVQWALSKIGWESVFGTVTPIGVAKLAILDTGVDASHPDLAGNVIPGTSILDGTNGLTDSNGHGTSLAGIAAAMTDNVTGIAGVGYAGVHIMPVTVLGANGLGQDSDIIAGIIWAADQGADVILMGFSNPDFSQNLQDAIDYAWSKGAVMVAATGNDGVSAPTFPAGNRSIIGVSATDESDLLVAGSNYGLDTFLAAPGANIYTTSLGGNYTYISGTSASSAVVAGVAAFMKAVDPSLTNGVIVGRLAKSADAIGTAGDPNNQTMFGNGRVNMANAIANTSIDPVQPAGADPVGNGGPYVGPYTAASVVMPIESISSTPQSSPLTHGFAGSTNYSITVIAGSGWLNLASLSITGLPVGATDSINQSIWDNLFIGTYTTTMTVTTTAATPAGSFPLIIHNSNNGVTGLATLVIGNGISSQTITVDTLAPANSLYGSTFNVAAHASSGLPVAITTSGSCSGSGSSTGVSSPVTVSMTSGSGACSVNYNQAGNANYSAATQVSSVTNATPRPVTISADAKSKVYGAVDPALTFTSTGLVSGDSFTGALTRAAGENTGTYAITQGTLATGGNYSVTFTGANLTINPAALTVTADAKSKVYGAVDPALTFTSTGLVSGDSFTGALTRAAGENTGTYAITQGTLATGGNYSVTFTGANLTINPAALTVTADAKSKVYGAVDPALTFTSTGLVSGDSFTGALTRAAGENTGTYAITQGTLATGGNYSVTFTGANLTINPAALTVTADAKSKVYGAVDPALTFTSTGLVSGDSFTGALTRAAGENTGTYAITQGTLATGGNYSVTFTGANLTINPAALTVTADAKSKVYGAVDPALTFTSTGLVSGDSFTGALTRAAGENTGTYAITQGTLATGGNYSVTFTGANLTINPAALTVTADAKSKVYGAVDPALTFTSTGLVSGDSFTGALTRAAGENTGTYAITQGTLATGGNYSVTFTGANLTINPAALTVTADAKSKVYGAVDPALTFTSTGLVSGDSFTGALTRAAGENTGTYAITQGTLATGGNYTITFIGANLTITKATPVITWANPADIIQGTPLSGTQLNATANVPGSPPVYTPALGTILPSGNNQLLKVDFTPTDTINYSSVSKTVSINVTQIPCGTPSSITVPPTNSTGTFQVSWGTSNLVGVTYVLESIKGSVTTQIYSGTSTSTYVTVTNGSYIFQVKAIKSGYGDSLPRVSGPCAVALVCGIPSSITVPATNSTGSFQVSWGSSDVVGVTYALEQSFNGGAYAPIYSGTSLSTYVTITTNGTYTYRVRATKTGYDPSPYNTSGNCGVTLVCGIPSSINVPATNSTGSIQVIWGASDVVGVTYALEQSFNGGAYAPIYSGTSLSTYVTITTNGTYTYRVRATKTGYDPSPYNTSGNCGVTLVCGIPSSINVPATNSTGSTQVIWGASDVVGVTYALEQSFNGGAYAPIYSGTSLSTYVTITTNGTYTYRVRATKTGYDPSPYNTSGNCGVTLVCGIPSSINVPATNSTGSIQVIWGASDVVGVTYVLEQNSGSGFTQVYSGTSTSTYVTITTNGTYSYRVKAIKSGGYADSPYNTSSSCTVALACGIPSSITVPSSNSTGSVQVIWGASDVAGVTYILESIKNGGTPTQVYSGTNVSTYVTITTNGTYSYQVRALRSGYETSSNKVSSDCQVTLVCGVPSSITVPATNSTGSIQVIWGASDVAGVTYALESSKDGAAFTPVYSGTSTSTYVTVTGIGHYIFRVKAIKSGYADSSYNTSGECVVTLACGTPSSITVPATNLTGSFQVTWGTSNVAGVTYILESIKDGGTPTQVYSGTGTSTYVTITANGNYVFQVKAIKSGYGDSLYRVSGNCGVTLACGTPTSITVPAINTTGSFTVSWGTSNVAGVTYVLESSTDGFSTFTQVYSGTSTSKLVSGLATGNYTFRVRATKPNYATSGDRTSTVCAVTR